jgi:hypothetical protein
VIAEADIPPATQPTSAHVVTIRFIRDPPVTPSISPSAEETNTTVLV